MEDNNDFIGAVEVDTAYIQNDFDEVDDNPYTTANLDVQEEWDGNNHDDGSFAHIEL